MWCHGKTHQCKGFQHAKIYMCRGNVNLRDKRQRTIQEDAVLCDREDVNLLDLLGPKWNLTRPILHDNLFPREPGYTELWESLKRREMVPRMAEVGIRKILPAYVFMWSPLCIMSLQKRSFRSLEGPYARRFLQKEIWNLQLMKQQHEALIQSSTPTLVVSYADLLFREEYALGRINTFLPCAGGVHADYLPQLNVDVFPGNRWKVRGTVHDFSKDLDPVQCCGYDIHNSRCANRTYFKIVPEFEEELNDLEAYFLKYSSETETDSVGADPMIPSEADANFDRPL